MERRCFLRKMATTAAGTTAGVVASGAVSAAEAQEPTRLRVTVLRVTLDQELAERYRDGEAEPCPVFQEGQEFVFESPFRHPDDFCHWAWADIRSWIVDSYFGREQPMVACCTDGIRPVIFKIERITA